MKDLVDLGEGFFIDSTYLGDSISSQLNETHWEQLATMTLFLIAVCLGVYANAVRIIHTD